MFPVLPPSDDSVLVLRLCSRHETVLMVVEVSLSRTVRGIEPPPGPDTLIYLLSQREVQTLIFNEMSS